MEGLSEQEKQTVSSLKEITNLQYLIVSNYLCLYTEQINGQGPLNIEYFEYLIYLMDSMLEQNKLARQSMKKIISIFSGKTLDFEHQETFDALVKKNEKMEEIMKNLENSSKETYAALQRCMEKTK